MELIRADVPMDFEVALIGDTHEGTILQHGDGIQETIAWVLGAKNRYVIHHGDWIEAIMRDDKRYDDCTMEDKPLEQVKTVIRDFAPVRNRILCGLTGNHELKLRKYGDLTKFLCGELGIPYGTYSAKVSFYNNDNLLFKGHVTHGFGSLKSNAKDHEQRMANMKAALKMRLKNKFADCAFHSMGHTHHLFTVEPSRRLYLTDDGNKIKQHYKGTATNGDFIDEDMRWYANTGSYLKGYELGQTSYPEFGGYDPVELGYIRLSVHDGVITSMDKVTL